VHQVGFITPMYRDAHSTRHKKNLLISSI